MKKVILFSILLVLISLNVNAQDSNSKYYYSLGLKSGFGIKDFSVVNSQSYDGYNSKLYEYEFDKAAKAHSYGATFELGIMFNENINLGTGINYVRREQEGMYHARSFCGCGCLHGLEYLKLVSNNIEIPLSFRMHFLKNKKLQPLFSSEIYWSKDFLNNSMESAPAAFNYLGYRLGVGISYDLGNSKLLLNPSYNRSLKSLNEFEYQYQEIVIDIRWVRTIGN